MAAGTAAGAASTTGDGVANIEGIAHTSFANTGFLRTHGLSTRNALEYFFLSPFYACSGGMTSLNELRRRGEQVAHTGNYHEFVLAYSNEAAKEGRVETSVFVIQKVSHQKVPSDSFYIIAGHVYKAPQLSGVFDSALHQVAASVDTILRRQVERLSRKRHWIAENTDTLFVDVTDTGHRPRWPEWCFFEKRALPSAWIYEAVKTSVPGRSRDESSIVVGVTPISDGGRDLPEL